MWEFDFSGSRPRQTAACIFLRCPSRAGRKAAAPHSHSIISCTKIALHSARFPCDDLRRPSKIPSDRSDWSPISRGTWLKANFVRARIPSRSPTFPSRPRSHQQMMRTVARFNYAGGAWKCPNARSLCVPSACPTSQWCTRQSCALPWFCSSAQRDSKLRPSRYERGEENQTAAKILVFCVQAAQSGSK